MFTRQHTCSQQTGDCCDPGGNLSLNLNCRAAQAVTSSFLWRTLTSKTADTWIICRVMRNSCLPCKRYCRAASRDAARRTPVALLVMSRVNVPSGVTRNMTVTSDVTLTTWHGYVTLHMKHFAMLQVTPHVLTHWIEAKTKWTPFRRRHFQVHFREWKCLNSD